MDGHSKKPKAIVYKSNGKLFMDHRDAAAMTAACVKRNLRVLEDCGHDVPGMFRALDVYDGKGHCMFNGFFFLVQRIEVL